MDEQTRIDQMKVFFVGLFLFFYLARGWFSYYGTTAAWLMEKSAFDVYYGWVVNMRLVMIIFWFILLFVFFFTEIDTDIDSAEDD